MSTLDWIKCNISISDCIQIIIALSALLAVIAALFGETIRLWLYGPRIIIEFDKENERCFRGAIVVKDIIQDQSGIFENVKRQYFRLRVANKGLTVARQLKAKVELYFPDGSLADRFEPSFLRWVSGQEFIDLATEEEEYLNLISQVIDQRINGYRLRVELSNMALRGIAWDRGLSDWVLKVSVHGENINAPIVRFFQFNPLKDENQPGNLIEVSGNV